MEYITRTLDNLVHQTAFLNLTWGNYLMICVALVFMYLAIAKDFEPLLLVPISFGMLLVNIYPDIIAAPTETTSGGLLYYFFTLDEWAILPSLIFIGGRRNDGLRPADRQSIQLSDGSCCPVRNLFRIFRRDRARI